MQDNEVGILLDKSLGRGLGTKGGVGKLDIRLVDHDHAGTSLAELGDKIERREVTRGIVGRSHDSQVARRGRLEHRRAIELKGLGHGIGVLVCRKVDARGRKVRIIRLDARQIRLHELLHLLGKLCHRYSPTGVAPSATVRTSSSGQATAVRSVPASASQLTESSPCSRMRRRSAAERAWDHRPSASAKR